MVRRLFPLCLALASITANACAGDDGEPLAHQIDDAQVEVTDLRAELDAHRAAAMQAPDLAALQDAEATHHANATAFMADLQHSITDMGMCDGAPHDPVDVMADMIGACESEFDQHSDAIAGAADLDQALAEEARHHQAMSEYLDDLGAMMDDMMAGHGTAMCSGHHGMDDHDSH